MTTFNKRLINIMDNNKISQKDYFNLLILLSILNTNKKKHINLQKEKDYLMKEIYFIKSRQHQEKYTQTKKKLIQNLDKIYNIDEIEILKKSLNIKKLIINITKKYTPPQEYKSSIIKYTKQLQYLLKKKENIIKEIQNSKNELSFLKQYNYKKQHLEKYINNLTRNELPKIEKEILKQKFYIDIFSKNKGR